MMLEYMIPSSHKGTMISDGNKPLWIFGFASNEYNLDTKNVTHAETYSMIDAKWGVADEWVTTYKYILFQTGEKDKILDVTYTATAAVGADPGPAADAVGTVTFTCVNGY